MMRKVTIEPTDEQRQKIWSGTGEELQTLTWECIEDRDAPDLYSVPGRGRVPPAVFRRRLELELVEVVKYRDQEEEAEVEKIKAA